MKLYIDIQEKDLIETYESIKQKKIYNKLYYEKILRYAVNSSNPKKTKLLIENKSDSM